MGKTVPEVLSTARDRTGKLLNKKYFCRFFTEAVSHRARAFDISDKQYRKKNREKLISTTHIHEN